MWLRAIAGRIRWASSAAPDPDPQPACPDLRFRVPIQELGPGSASQSPCYMARLLRVLASTEPAV